MKTTLKRILSLVLAVCMLFTVQLFSGIIADAADTKASTVSFGDLKFIVPEAIYLYPNGSSDIAATSTNFQYYINNGSEGAVQSTYDTTGKIYFSYTNATGTTLSYRFLDRYMSAALSGGSVTLSNTSPGTYATINITGGKSPSLAVGVTGCYIEWKISFTDSTDKKSKAAYAYTYVYKPYTIPVGGFVRAENEDGTSSYCQSVTWMSGVHSIKVGTLHDNGGYYPKRKTNWGFASFITAGSTAYVGSTSVSSGYGKRQEDCWNAASKTSGAALWKLAFVNSGESSDAHYDTNKNNAGPTGYGKTSADSETYGVRSMDYWYKDKDVEYNLLVSLTSGASGNICIDTSRYSNLSQIPNLAVGCSLTDNENGTWGCWYIGDASGRTGYRTSDYWTGADNRTNYYNDKNYVIAGVGTSATNTSKTDSWDEEGVQYAGPWPRTLLGSTGTQGATYMYSVRSWYTAEEDSTGTNDFALNTCLVDLNATYYNKATLRAAVQRATRVMPALGVNGLSGIGKPSSCYFDANSSYKWDTFQTAYQKAVRVLGSVDMQTGISDSPATLATALNNALNALCTKVTYNGNGGTLSGTTTVYQTIGTNPNVSITPNVTKTRSGYTFLGWNTDKNATTGSSSLYVGYNQTVYAIWTKNVTAKFWRLNGTESISETLSTTIFSNQNYATVTATQPATTVVYEGRSLTWLGFTTAKTADSTTQYTTDLTYNVSGGENFNSLYYGTLLLQFNPSGGSGAPVQQSARQYLNANNSGITDNGCSFTISTTVPTKTGAQFLGWSTSQTATVAQYQPGDTIEHVMTNTTLYAVWAANVYYVEYKGNNATSGEMDISTHYYGTPSPLNKNRYSRQYTVTYNSLDGRPDTTDSAVATFRGWSNTATSSVVYGDEQVVTNLSKADGATVTIFAQWTLGKVTLKDISRTGYSFRGWYKNSSLTNLAGNAGAEFTPTMNTTLYAMWDPNSYKVVYNGNGATDGSMRPSDHIYDTASPLTLNAYSREFTVTYDYAGATGGEMPLTGSASCLFNGWATSATGSPEYYDGENVLNLADSGSTILYATWLNGKVTLPAPEKTNYDFGGWYTDADLTTPAGDAGSRYTVSDSITLYAKWILKANPKLVPAAGSATVVNYESNFIYGLPDRDIQSCSDVLINNLCGITDGEGYVTYEYSNPDNVIGTGTKINLHRPDGTIIDTYTVVIFGDNDGDGYITMADVTDATYFDALLTSTYDYEDLSVANVKAMDVNGDGMVDQRDITIVTYYAAMLIDEIDQSGIGTVI